MAKRAKLSVHEALKVVLRPKVKLAIRGFAGGNFKKFEDRIEATEKELDELLPKLGEKHARALADHSLHMIEIEFLDEPDPLQRFFRFGTDAGGMVRPLEVDLATFLKR